MKYVLLGSISPSWIGKQAERYKKSNEKLKQLGIKQVSVLYTQGQYDFVETIEAPGPESVLGFTIWYSKKGFGNIQTLPAFGDQEIRKIIKKDNKKSQATTCSLGYISTNSSNWKSLKSLLIDEYKFKYSTSITQ